MCRNGRTWCWCWGWCWGVVNEFRWWVQLHSFEHWFRFDCCKQDSELVWLCRFCEWLWITNTPTDLQQLSIWTLIRRFCIHRSVVCKFSSHISLLPFKLTDLSRFSCRNGLMFKVINRLLERFIDLRLGIRWNRDAYKCVIWEFWRSSV